MADLDWEPEFPLLDGLKDSYKKDFGRGTFRKEANFKCDDLILAKVGAGAKVVAGDYTLRVLVGKAWLVPPNLEYRLIGWNAACVWRCTPNILTMNLFETCLRCSMPGLARRLAARVGPRPPPPPPRPRRPRAPSAAATGARKPHVTLMEQRGLDWFCKDRPPCGWIRFMVVMVHGKDAAGGVNAAGHRECSCAWPVCLVLCRQAGTCHLCGVGSGGPHKAHRFGRVVSVGARGLGLEGCIGPFLSSRARMHWVVDRSS